MILLLRLTLISLVLYSGFAGANTAPPITKSQVTERLEATRSDEQSLPNDILKELNLLIDISKQNQWHDNLLEAQTQKAEQYLSLEQFPLAKAIVEKYLATAKANSLERIYYRLLMVELGVESVAGYSPDLEQKINNLAAIADKWPEQNEAASIHLNVGHAYYTNGKLQKALLHTQKAYNIFNQTGESSYLSLALNSLANLYTDLNDLDTAVSYLHQAIEIKRELNDITSMSVMYYNLGRSYIDHQKFDLAFNALEESKKLAIQIDDEVGITWANQAIGDIHILRNEPEKAIPIFEQAAPVFKEINDNLTYFESLHGLFEAYMQLDDIENAQVQIDKITPLLSTLNSDFHTAKIKRQEATLYAKKQEWQMAYDKLNSHLMLHLKIDEQEKNKEIQKYKIKFDSELKEQENQILQKENELHTLKISQQHNEKIFWWAVSGSTGIALVIIAYLLHRENRSRNQFKRMAFIDPLTESPNRRSILLQAERLIDETQEHNTSLLIGLIDLDYFKKINDSYGHDVGDEVLIAFAKACQDSLREQDYFGRYGGEEWLVVLNHIERDNAVDVFRRIQQKLNATAIEGVPSDKRITFSVGVSIFDNEHINTLRELINNADENLYKAKANGRNRIDFDDNEFLLDDIAVS